MSDRKIVRKHRDLILARNTWSETEGKLFATLIKELNPKEEKDFKLMKITIDDLEKLWGKKQVNTTRIRNTCLDLQTKAYELPRYNEQGKLISYRYFSLFDEIEYHLDDKIISFEFSKNIKPFVLEFTKRFVSYNIENILSFKCKYSISFYERFKYDDFKKEKIKVEILDIEYIKGWLNLKNTYKRINDFKKYILDKVVIDLKKHSDVYMNYEFIKSGRKITHIKFNYGKNLSEAKREQSFFSDEELENKYNKYINKPFLNNGVEYKIKVLTPIDDFYVATYYDGQTSKIYDLKNLEKMINAYK